MTLTRNSDRTILEQHHDKITGELVNVDLIDGHFYQGTTKRQGVGCVFSSIRIM